VRIAIAEVGLDPSIGYLHVCQPRRQTLAYELTEPYQPKVDREVRAFIRSQAFTPRDFVIDAKGVCRVHPELAQALVSVLGGLTARETTRESALVFFSARSRP